MTFKKESPQDKDWLRKAYDNPDFLHSPAARNIRILTEMIEPADRLRRNHIRHTVVFFGSARTLSRTESQQKLKLAEKKLNEASAPSKELETAVQEAKAEHAMSRYYEDAVILAEKLTLWFNKSENKDKHFRICSGGGPGIMEAANRGAKQANGESIGLNIALPFQQEPNIYQTKDISFEFHYFFIRKFWFFYLSKAMIVFPGGFGTLDELFELLTIIQTGKTRKYMPIVLYGKDYWNELINFEAMLKWGMISKEDLKLFKICDTIDETFTYLKDELTKHYLKKKT